MAKAKREQDEFDESLDSYNKKSKNKLFLPSTVLLICCLLSGLASALQIAPPNRYLHVGDTYQHDIIATRPVVDEKATQAAREAAAKDVQPIYTGDAAAYRDAESRAERFLNAMDSLRSDADSLRRQIIQASERDSELRNYEEGSLTAAEWNTVLGEMGHQRLESSLYGEWFDADEIDRLLALPQTNYNSWLRDVTLRLNTQLRKGIQDDQLEEIQTQFVKDLDKSTPITVQSTLPNIAAYCIVPTMLRDEAASEEAVALAKAQVPNVMIDVGEPLLAAGQALDQNTYQILLESGDILSFQSMVNRWLSILAFYVVMYLLLMGYLAPHFKRIFAGRKELLMFVLSVVLNLVLASILLPLNVYANTIVLGVLLLTQLLSPSAALLVTVILAPSIGFISGGVQMNYMLILRALLASIVGASAGIFVIRNSMRRSSVLQGALCSGLGMVCVYAVFATIGNSSWGGFLQVAGFTLLVNMLCGILEIGILPLWEWMFDATTSARLLELSDINHPLLQRLMIEAPGTYNHSVMVGTLAEAAATAIGANASLTRVGAYFHDVGKLKRPQFFVENQHGVNPHDQLDPTTSAAIIIAHVADGVELAKESHLPRAVCEMIPQHHGDSMTAAFYYKAVEQSGDKDLSPVGYRYPGPRPQTKEAAILMLADSVEAAVRSLPKQTPTAVSDRIDKVISGKILDHQLSECDLTLEELEKVRLTMLQVYDGLLHERLEYPDIDKLIEELADQGHLDTKKRPLGLGTVGKDKAEEKVEQDQIKTQDLASKQNETGPKGQASKKDQTNKQDKKGKQDKATGKTNEKK